MKAAGSPGLAAVEESESHPRVSASASSSSRRASRSSGDAGGSSVGRLAWHQMVGVTFFAVCGGDYGIEDAVGAAGPRLTMLGLLLLPWLWSLPIGLMTAELGSMIPEAGGYVVWVHRALGPFWAHQNALWNLVSNAFDNALYPVMFVDYLKFFPAFRRLAGVRRWLVSVGMLSCVTGLNLLGVDVVASASTLFAALVISPFAALTIAGLPALDFHALTAESTRCARSPALSPLALGPLPSTLYPPLLYPAALCPLPSECAAEERSRTLGSRANSLGLGHVAT